MEKFKTILFWSLLGMVGLFQACNSLQKESSAEAIAPLWAIAPFLDRPEGLGSEEEETYFKDSYHQLKNQLVQEPENWDVYLKIAQLFMLEARVTGEHGHYYPAALQVLDRVLYYAKKDEAQFQASFLKASVLLSLHKFNDALSFGEQALAYNDQHSLTYGTLVDAHVELGNYDKAVELVDKMNAIRPDLRSYARVSYIREIHGDVEGAIEAMELAVKAGLPGQEDAAWCRLTLADLYFSYGRIEEAREQYLIALQERPNYPFAQAGLAKVYASKGNYQNALELLDEACKLIPEVSFYEQKAHIYKELGEEEKVRGLAEEIVKMLKEDEASGHKMNLEFADVYADLYGNDSLALTYIWKEYQERPRHIGVNHSLASIYFKQGKYEKALTHSREAIRTQSQDPEIRVLHGIILCHNGLEEEGWTYIQTSLQKNPRLEAKYAAQLQQLSMYS